MAFYGGFSHSLDDKGRIILPIKFRYSLGEKFIACRGLHGCIFIFPVPEWNKFEQHLSEQAFTDLDAVRLQRWFCGSAFELTTDNQNRLAIPATLREHAGIDKDAIVVGAANRLELWAPQRWEEINADISAEDLSRSAQAIGFGRPTDAQAA